MKVRPQTDADTHKHPPGRGRSASDARRVGVTSASRFNRTKKKTECARRLRCHSTVVETRLWSKLRHGQIDGYAFRRQHPAGPYVLNFYCPALRLAIELDGGQHTGGQTATRDRQRDLWLKSLGVTVLRFWNNDVTTNLSGVLQTIAAKVADLRTAGTTPTRRWRADLPLSGGGER